jgi:hypothetical protein
MKMLHCSLTSIHPGICRWRSECESKMPMSLNNFKLTLFSANYHWLPAATRDARWIWSRPSIWIGQVLHQSNSWPCAKHYDNAWSPLLWHHRKAQCDSWAIRAERNTILSRYVGVGKMQLLGLLLHFCVLTTTNIQCEYIMYTVWITVSLTLFFVVPAAPASTFIFAVWQYWWVLALYKHFFHFAEDIVILVLLSSLVRSTEIFDYKEVLHNWKLFFADFRKWFGTLWKQYSALLNE